MEQTKNTAQMQTFANTIREIILDLRNMPHEERHEKIFSSLGSMGEGQTLKIINDHDPKPLRYMLEAEHKGEFSWQYEKEGPKNWIVGIKKIGRQNEKKALIKELLIELHSGADAAKIKEKGKSVFSSVSPTDLALIEQEIIQEGVGREEMKKLCNVHLEIMKDSLNGASAIPKPGHPIHTLMEEHKIILGFIEELKKASEKIARARNFTEAKKEIEILGLVAGQLIEANNHHKREEEALFPALEKHGVSEPPAIMREEHIELKAGKKALKKLVAQGKKMRFGEFAKEIKQNADFIASELPQHIFKEDNILYPMALQVVQEKEWRAIKKKCDKIGYCRFTPARRQKT